MSDDARQGDRLKIEWTGDGLIGRLTIGGEHWASVEWSEKRQRWCVEDSQGQCLKHTASIRGAAGRGKEEAVALAEAMVRDSRMPTPEQARAEHAKSVAASHAKSDSSCRRKSRRREERKKQLRRWGRRGHGRIGRRA